MHLALSLDPLDWSDTDAVEAYLAVVSTAHTVDLPGDPSLCEVEQRGAGGYPWPATAEPVWLVRAGAGVVAFVHGFLSLEENLDVFGFDLVVHPDHRGRGIGRGALEQVHALARADGRSRLLCEVAEERGGGGRSVRFAEAAGFRCVLPDVQRRLDLRAVDAEALDRMLADAWAHAEGYSLVQWTGRTPEDHVDDTAVLESRMTIDPPLDDLQWEPEPADPARIRARDAMLAGRGQTRYVTGVRHDASGVLIGCTSIVRNATDPVGVHQWETIVLGEHRGHRLGVLLKLESLRYVRRHEPAMRTVDTLNAASNTHMVAVNDAVGFRVVRGWGEWEKRLG